MRFTIELEMPDDETTAGWTSGIETAHSLNAVLHEIPTDTGDVVVPEAIRISVNFRDDGDRIFLYRSDSATRTDSEGER